MRLLAIVAVMCACGPGLSQVPEYRNPKVRDFSTELTSASQQRDVGRVRALLRDEVTTGGLWFADVACMKQFAYPAHITGPALDELARCLTTLSLTPSTRHDALPDVVLLTYDPGVELEARFLDTVDGPWLAWIGYAGRRSMADALPTVSAATLEALRIEGDASAPLAGPGAFDDLATLKVAYAWLKVCIDGSGAVTGMHVREASSPRAARTFAAAMKTWRFKPFVLGTQPVPVCSMVQMVYPSDKKPTNETLPLPVPDTPDDVVNVPSATLGERVAGRTLVQPDDMDKMRLKQARIRRLIAALHYCIDETGRVAHVTLIRSSGLPGYDRKLVAAAQGWAFHPYLDEGKPITVCSSTHYTYNQR